MRVPLTLLGLLERGPGHGYDMKRDYGAYFGRGRPLRYSQVYATLSRLARDGKAVAGAVKQGAGPERRRYVITGAGLADVERWLAEPAAPRWKSGRARSSRSWGRAAPASPPCCTAWRASWSPREAGCGSAGTGRTT